jgi:hypothetical protein
MAKLIFYDDDHRYEVDGEELPSVSQISRFASREVYGEISQYKLDNACARGSAVHKATEVLDKYKECEVTEDIETYIRAYVQFKKDFCVGDYVAIEKPLASELLKFAGTIDRIMIITKEFAQKVLEVCGVDITNQVGKLAIIDLKSSSVVQKVLAKIQLNGYQKLVEENALGEVGALFILHLEKNNKYKLMPFDINDTLFMSCLNLHNEFRPKRKKKEN